MADSPKKSEVPTNISHPPTTTSLEPTRKHKEAITTPQDDYQTKHHKSLIKHYERINDAYQETGQRVDSTVTCKRLPDRRVIVPAGTFDCAVYVVSHIAFGWRLYYLAQCVGVVYWFQGNDSFSLQYASIDGTKYGSQ
jgi:hypothetical protein